MLRHGVSLAGVGAVLRHRDPTMTMHYAKVDFALPLRDCPALGGEAGMLIDDIERYLTLRRSLGFKLERAAEYLGSFARFAAARGERHIRTQTAIEWAQTAPTSGSRYTRLRDVVRADPVPSPQGSRP